MLSGKDFHLGDLRGVLYDLPKIGDGLDKHVHTEADVHITIVLAGRVRVASHDWSLEVEAGKIVDFRVGEPHEITAIEDGTRILNLRKMMQPATPPASE